MAQSHMRRNLHRWKFVEHMIGRVWGYHDLLYGAGIGGIITVVIEPLPHK